MTYKKSTKNKKTAKDINPKIGFNPVKNDTENGKSSKIVWSTEALDTALEGLDQGFKLKANPFYDNNTKLLKADLLFERTPEELEHFKECMKDVLVFAKECQLMTPQGIQHVKLRDYQEEYLKHLQNNRLSIFLSCRQSGKCLSPVDRVDIRITKPSKRNSEVLTDDIIEKWNKNYRINDNEYNIPVFEILNLFKSGIKWRIKYNLYELISNLNIQKKRSNLFIKLLYKIISIIDHLDYNESDEKLVESYPLNNIDILTDTGFKPLSYAHLTKPFQIYNLVLEDGYHLTCADTHIVFDNRFNEVFVKDVQPGDLLMTDSGPKRVISVTTANTSICMCDVTVNDNNHRFYSNGILSHNTTTSAIFMLWYVLFNVDKNALVLGNKYKTAKEILDKIKNIFYYLPYYLKPGIRKWNEAEIVFDNGCRIMAEATTINSGISFTYHCVLADEFAHIAPNIVDKFYNQIFPTITAGKARFIISSTQNGFNLFYKLYKGAEAHENDYGPFKVDWNQVPEWNPDLQIWEKRDEAWHQKQAANLGGEEAFQKQFGTSFDITGNTLINAKKIRKISATAEEFRPIDMPGQIYSECFKWKTSEIHDIGDLKKMYLTLTIDLAEGIGQDSDIMNIHQLKWDSDLEKTYCETIGVCEINDITVPVFAEVVVDFVSRYCDMNNTILSFESNTFGSLFYKSITSYTDKNPNLLWDSGILARYEKDMFSDSKDISKTQVTGSKYMLGFKVTHASKKAACKIYKLYFEDNLIRNIYTKYITQMENFSDLNGNGSYEATYGHDDIIMAEVQQAALMQTLKYKLLQESFEGSLAVSSSGIEYVNYYDNEFGIPAIPGDQYHYNGDDLYTF